MFEDQNQNSAPQAGAPPQPSPAVPQSAAPSASSSVPQAGAAVEDIFAATEPQSAPGAQAAIPGPPTALTQGKLKPLDPSGQQGMPASAVAGVSESGFPFKKMIAILAVSAVIIGGAAAAFYVLQGNVPGTPDPQTAPPENRAANSDASPQADEEADTTESSGIEDSSAEAVDADANTETADSSFDKFQQNQIDRALNPIPQDPASVDTDQDGLLDAQEFGHGTNPRLVDSDNDGLSDWEEIAIFGTDPLNRDSDGDTYTDGEEVQNGYNPLGPGKLLNIEQANQETQ